MLTLSKPDLPAKPISKLSNITLADVHRKLVKQCNSRRLYTLQANYKGRKEVLGFEPMSFKDAYIIRSKYEYYPHRSIEIIRIA